MPLTARDVRDVKFSTALRGYAVDEVDDLLDLIAAALDDLEQGRTPRLSGSDVERQVFNRTLRGYDLDEVDDFLDQAVSTLEGRRHPVSATRASSQPLVVQGVPLRADHPVLREGGGPAWLWLGVSLLTLSGLVWALTVAALIDEPTDIGVTLMESAVLSAIPVLTGLWALRRGRWTKARRAHTIPRLWVRIGWRVLLIGLGFAVASLFFGDDEASVGVLFAIIGVVIWAIAGFLRVRQTQRFQPTVPLMIHDAALTPYSAGLMGIKARLVNTTDETLRDTLVEPFRYRREWVVLSGSHPVAAELRPGAEISYQATIAPVTKEDEWRQAIESGSWGLLATYRDESGRQWEQLFYP